MRRRSITAFIMALLASLLVIIFGYIFMVIFALIVGLSGEFGEVFELVYSIANILMYVGVVVALVGSGFSFVKARVTAILLTIATILVAIYPCMSLYVVLTLGEAGSVFIVGPMFIPTIMLAVGTLTAFLAKARPKLIQDPEIKLEGENK